MATAHLMKVWTQGDSLIVTLKKDIAKRLKVTSGDYLMGYVSSEGIFVASKHEATRNMMNAIKEERKVVDEEHADNSAAE